MKKSTKPIVKLAHFTITNEYGYFHLVGKAIDHPRLKTTFVTSSRLVKIDFGKMEAETLNTIYLLEGN